MDLDRTAMLFYLVTPMDLDRTATLFFRLYSALQAALKMTKAELELISDSTLYLFFEKMKRGGLSFVGSRFAESNVPGSPHYDPRKGDTHIFYTGKTMSVSRGGRTS